jgi:hypothetical protein
MRRRNAFSRPDRQAGSSGFRRAMGLCGRFTRMVLLILMMSQGLIAPCRAAGLMIEALSSSARPGSSGSFDIVLINSNSTGGTSYNVASNSLDISLSGTAGVTINDVNMITSANYIFTQSLDANYGLPFATINTPTSFSSNDAGDVVNGYPGYQVVNPGETYGLAHVDYTVSSTAAIGSRDTISIESINSGTSLSDENNNGISFAPVNGTVIIGSSVVPEPSALIQGATAVLIGLGALGWNRRPEAS